MKRWIICVPQKWEERQVASPYSVMADTPKRAVEALLTEKPMIRKNVNGEITVVEAKAGRLDNWFHYYKISQFPEVTP